MAAGKTGARLFPEYLHPAPTHTGVLGSLELVLSPGKPGVIEVGEELGLDDLSPTSARLDACGICSGNLGSMASFMPCLHSSW